jgi:hypothetical protein
MEGARLNCLTRKLSLTWSGFFFFFELVNDQGSVCEVTEFEVKHAMADDKGKIWPLADAELTNSVSIRAWWMFSTNYAADFGSRPACRAIQASQEGCK